MVVRAAVMAGLARSVRGVDQEVVGVISPEMDGVVTGLKLNKTVNADGKVVAAPVDVGQVAPTRGIEAARTMVKVGLYVGLGALWRPVGRVNNHPVPVLVGIVVGQDATRVVVFLHGQARHVEVGLNTGSCLSTNNGWETRLDKLYTRCAVVIKRVGPRGDLGAVAGPITVGVAEVRVGVVGEDLGSVIESVIVRVGHDRVGAGITRTDKSAGVRLEVILKPVGIGVLLGRVGAVLKFIVVG